jgi:hypothetical protein
MQAGTTTDEPRPHSGHGVSKKPKVYGAYSRNGSLAFLDQRTAPVLFLKQHRNALIEHCGGRPSAVQQMLIERCCWLALRLSQLERKMATNELTEHDTQYFISWSNAYSRTVAKLGVKGTAPQAASLADVVADINAGGD